MLFYRKGNAHVRAHSSFAEETRLSLREALPFASREIPMPEKSKSSKGSHRSSSSLTPDQTALFAAILLTKPQLAGQLRLSVRSIENLMAQRLIPYIRAGRRSVRFHLPRVLAALERREVKEVGRR